VLIHNGTFQNGTLHNDTLQKGALNNGTLEKVTLSNGAGLQNGTGTEWYIVIKRYMLQNGAI
jgi:hypothetical protein